MTMRWRRLGFVGIAVAAGIFAGWHVLHGPDGARAAGPAPAPQVPVTTTTTQVQDVPVYLDGLGTVQAFNVVEIKAQVNGSLIALAGARGAGGPQGRRRRRDRSAPYKAALDQAVAQRAEDAAQLQSAQLDLQRYQDAGASAVSRRCSRWTTSRRRSTRTSPPSRRQRRDRDGADQSRLLRHPRADRRARQPVSDGRRQPDRGGQPDRHRVDHAGQADRGGVHPAGGRAGAACRPRRAKAQCRSWRSTARIRHKALGHRHAADAEQHDRHDDGHDLAEGDIR